MIVSYFSRINSKNYLLDMLTVDNIYGIKLTFIFKNNPYFFYFFLFVFALNSVKISYGRVKKFTRLDLFLTLYDHQTERRIMSAFHILL